MKSTYIKSTNLYQEAQRRYEELNRAKLMIEKRFSNYPEGKVHIVTRNGNCQYYIRTNCSDKSGKYISKKETKKIALYLQKKYDEKVLGCIEREIKSLKVIGEKPLNELSNNNVIAQIYSSYPDEIKKVISPIDMTDEDYIKWWLSIPFVKKDIGNTTTIYESDNKEIVRSKSELNIANTLKKMGVPYKYECPLTLKGGVTIHPDFTLLDVSRRREVYWEHRGMMDDIEYAKNSVRRIKQLNRNGIVVGDNLIITEETLTYSLGTDELENIIRKNFICI